MEKELVSSILTSRDAFDCVEKYLNPDEEFSQQSKIIFELVKDFYSGDKEASKTDIAILSSRLEREYPKHAKVLGAFLSSVDGKVSSPSNVLTEILELKKERVRQNLANALLTGKDDEIALLMTRYDELEQNGRDVKEVLGKCVNSVETDNGRELFSGKLISELTSTYSRDNLIKLYPSALNDLLDGGVVRGTCIGLFARPEIGKSMFSINFACGFAANGLKVLYVCNEDPISSIAMRCVSRLSGLSRSEIIEGSQDSISKSVNTRGYSNITFCSMSPGSPDEIEEILRDNGEFDCVIVDQVRNLQPPRKSNLRKDGGLVQSLEVNAASLRDVAKRFNVVMLMVTQAGDSASNREVLDMSHIDSSKTGFPAQVDLLIGIGANEDMKNSNQRMISLPKNKVSGDHSFFPVMVNPIISKVSNI